MSADQFFFGVAGQLLVEGADIDKPAVLDNVNSTPALDKMAWAREETSSLPKSFLGRAFDVGLLDSVFKDFPPYRE